MLQNYGKRGDQHLSQSIDEKNIKNTQSKCTSKISQREHSLKVKKPWINTIKVQSQIQAEGAFIEGRKWVTRDYVLRNSSHKKV